MKKITKLLAGIPLVIGIPMLVAGTAFAAWLILGGAASITGSGTSASANEPIIIDSTSAIAVEGTGPDANLSCSMIKDGLQASTITIDSADPNYSGTDDGIGNDDACSFTANLTVGAGNELNGVKLVINGVTTIPDTALDSSNNSTQPFALDVTTVNATASDGCGGTGSMMLKFDLTLSELHSAPDTSYDFAGSSIETRVIGDPTPCFSTGF